VVRIGILGTARIARLFMGGSLRNARFTAIASRSSERAESFAREFGLERWYGSYDDLLADPNLDAVYIPLPHFLHAEFSLRAARAGKHVLVEKPAALSSAEFLQMWNACREGGVVLMESLMYRCKRIHLRVQELIREGAIGNVRHLNFSWCFPVMTLGRSRFRLDHPAGGALNDVGIYGADFLRLILGSDLKVISGGIWRASPGGVDLLAHALCSSPGSTASLTCGYLLDANYYVVGGERGSIYVPGSVSGRIAENLLRVHRIEDDRWDEERFAPENPYHALADHFGEVIEGRVEPLIRQEQTLANLRMLEDIRRLATEWTVAERGSITAPPSAGTR
jgi:predicted dehydrogenase